MTRQPEPHPTKSQLGEMTVAQLNDYIRSLRRQLEWCKSGPVHNIRTKQLEVALKVRDIRNGRERADEA